LAEAIDEMVEDIRTLGPLNWSRNWAEDGTHLDDVEKILHEHAEAMEVPQ
jgi:hypothetical protein